MIIIILLLFFPVQLLLPCDWGRRPETHHHLCQPTHRKGRGAHLRLQIPHWGCQDPLQLWVKEVPQVPQLEEPTLLEKPREAELFLSEIEFCYSEGRGCQDPLQLWLQEMPQVPQLGEPTLLEKPPEDESSLSEIEFRYRFGYGQYRQGPQLAGIPIGQKKSFREIPCSFGSRKFPSSWSRPTSTVGSLRVVQVPCSCSYRNCHRFLL